MWRLITFLMAFSCSVSHANELVELYYVFSGNDGDSESFHIDLPERALELKVESSGDVGDVDIFVFRPDEKSYLDFSFCSNRRQDSHEVCQVGMPKSGLYRIEAKAFQPNSSATLKISYLINYDNATFVDKRGSSSLHQLLMLDESRRIDFDHSIRFKTRVHPHRQTLSLLLEQTNEDVLLRVREEGASRGEPYVCEIRVDRNNSEQCDIGSPKGVYYVELIALSRGSVTAQLNVMTKVDERAVDTVWRDPQVKALKWEVAKEILHDSALNTYFFEMPPITRNLVDEPDTPIYNRKMNGFVSNSFLGSISMGFDFLTSLDQENCTSSSTINNTVCRYNAEMVRSNELLRVRVKRPDVDQNLEIVHKETTYYGKPSPTCSKEKGCDGEPDT